MENTMRRKDRQLSKEDARKILESGEYGVLACVDAQGQPYGVPVNYVYHQGSIYFHCAQADGYKDRNLAENPRVSFTVVGKTEILASRFTTAYESAIVFGRAEIAQGEEKNDALLALAARLCPEFAAEGKKELEMHGNHTRVYKITVDEISGKANRKKEEA